MAAGFCEIRSVIRTQHIQQPLPLIKGFIQHIHIQLLELVDVVVMVGKCRVILQFINVM